MPSSLRSLQRWCAVHPTRLFFLLSTFLLLALYRHVFAAGFVYDDVSHIPNNPALPSWSLLVSQYFERGVPFSADYLAGPGGSFYRPLFWLSLALDRMLFGLKPIGFHATNLLLHGANGWLGFLLLKRLGVPAQRAGAAILIWLILPVNSEAVAWISGRTYCLSALFVLLSLLFAEKYLRSGSRAALCAYCLGFALALLSHEAGLLVLPLTLLVAFAKKRGKSYSCGILGALGSAIVVAYFVLRTELHISSPVHFGSFSLIGLTIWKYLQWMLLPVQMSVERSSDAPKHGSTIYPIVAWFALVCLYIVVFRLRRRIPEFAAGLTWMGIALLPYSGLFFIYQGMAERYTYLASLGFTLAIVNLAWLLNTRKTSPLLLLFLAWIAWGAWRLNSRVADWHDDISLFSSSLRADPNSPVLLYNLGATLEDAGDLRTALLLTERAIALRPNYERAINGLGTIYLRIGFPGQAKIAFDRALSLDPVDELALSNLGAVYLQQGRFYEASVRFARALAIQPDDVRALSNFGVANVRMGNLDRAAKAFGRVLALAPNDNVARCNLAMVLFAEDKWGEAVQQLATAIRLSPSDANPYYFLGIVDEKMGSREAAIQMFEKAIQLKPDYKEAQAKLKELAYR